MITPARILDDGQITASRPISAKDSIIAAEPIQPGIQALRKLHLLHHRPDRMTQKNFNITYPVGDLLFGTLDRSARS